MNDIIIKKTNINHIPAIIVRRNLSNVLQNSIIIYHSFAHSKEDTLNIAYFLAEMGFMCICVDMDRHGERDNYNEKFPYKYFYSSMFNSAKDITQIIDYLNEDENIHQDISVVGISLGGMAALTSGVVDRRVKNIVTILASGNFIRLAQQKNSRVLSRILSDNQYDKEYMIKNTESLSKLYDPYYNCEQFSDKRLLMINGSIDMVIPLKIAKDFINRISDCNYANKENYELVVINGLGHEVHKIMIDKACIWLKKIIKGD